MQQFRAEQVLWGGAGLAVALGLSLLLDARWLRSVNAGIVQAWSAGALLALPVMPTRSMVRRSAAAGGSGSIEGEIVNKKLTLSRETLRALDDQDLTLVVGGSHQPHRGNSGVGGGRARDGKGRGRENGRGKKKGCSGR